MAIISCKYKNNDRCEYEGVPIAAITCQECLKDCEWQCTLYTENDRFELLRSLLRGLEEKNQPIEAILKTMNLYRNCSDDPYDYSNICTEAALLYLQKKHPQVLSEVDSKEAEILARKLKENEL